MRYNAELGAFVVMPNHVHGILVLNNGIAPVERGHALSLQSPTPPQTIGQQRFQNIGKNSVSSIMGSYKSAVSKHAHRLGFEFHWQSRFHDHIIRDEGEYQRIANYINMNPQNWRQDKFYQ
jgi:putative transposase